MPGTFPDKAINCNNKPEAQFDTIVYNGDIKIVTKNLIGIFWHTVSGHNFVDSFSFLKNWSIQSHSATFAYSKMASLNSRGFIFYNENYTKCFLLEMLNLGFWNLKSFFSEYSFYLFWHLCLKLCYLFAS